MINQDLLFGSDNKTFKVESYLQKTNEDKKKGDFKFTTAKEYFLKYFAKSFGDTRYFYEPQEEGDGLIQNIDDAKFKKKMEQIPAIQYHNHTTLNEDMENDKTNKKPEKFEIGKWFIKNHHTTYAINSDPRAKRFYESKKTGQKYINLSKGFLHKTVKKYADYSQKIKDNVEAINSHIKNIWNSGNEEAFEYCLNWFSCAFTGHKMESALFLKSGEGTGKSIIVDFIIDKVIGSELGMVTAKANQMMRFNSQLLGKIFVCLEELPSQNKSEWHSLSDILKDLITSSKMDIEQKYCDVIKTTNLISLMIFTNNDNTIKFGKDIRRYFMADVSHESVGNLEYYKQLKSAMTKETGEAYFMFLMERYEKIKDTFNCADIPMTESKLEMKIRNLTPLLKFVKEEFLCKGKGIKDDEHKLGKYEVSKLKDYINMEDKTAIFKTTQALNTALKMDLPFLKIANYGKNKTPHIDPVDFKTVLEFYKKKGFWSDTYDKVEGDIVQEEIQPEKEVDYKVLYEQQLKATVELQKKLEEVHKLLQQQQMQQNQPVQQQSIKNKPIKVDDLDDLEKDLLELESQIKPKKIVRKVPVVVESDNETDDEEIQFNIKPKNTINEFFN
jgi:hypothetical protein